MKTKLFLRLFEKHVRMLKVRADVKRELLIRIENQSCPFSTIQCNMCKKDMTCGLTRNDGFCWSDTETYKNNSDRFRRLRYDNPAVLMGMTAIVNRVFKGVK